LKIGEEDFYNSLGFENESAYEKGDVSLSGKAIFGSGKINQSI